MKVINWIAYDESDKYKDSVGGFGGFFAEGMRWKDFIDRAEYEEKEYYEAIRRDVLAKGIRINGDAHQYGPAGVPLFADNTVGTFSYRGWGDLMAAIWSEHESKDYNYMDFYC